MKNLPVFLESNNLKFLRKFNSRQEPIPVKNLNNMLLPTNLVKPVTPTASLKHRLFIMAKVSERYGKGRVYPKNSFFSFHSI